MIKKLLTLAMSLTIVLTMASTTAFATESTDSVNDAEISFIKDYEDVIDFR